MQVSRPSDLTAVQLTSRRSARSRRGVSILEVLFAIAVTTIGLLGAIAVFPVASAQARKGRISDAMAVAGMSAAHDFDVRGMRKPANWAAFDRTGAKFSPYDRYDTYVRAEASAAGTGTANHNYFCGRYMYCIDPLYLASNSGSLNRAFSFPASATGATDITVAGDNLKRMFRVTLEDPNGNGIGKAVAEALFVFDDDLTYDRPADRSLNAAQILDSISGTDYKRQSDGHMSWMATLVPKLDRMSTNFTNTYVLSVVVFYDRIMDDLAGTGPTSEHVFTVTSMPGTGITGGEVQLTSSDQTAIDRVKANDWILLRGTMTPAGGGTDKIPFARWYRVMDAEVDSEVSGSNYTKYVTLFGQDWDSANMSDMDAVYVEGVVGVYEKTIRLDMTP